MKLKNKKVLLVAGAAAVILIAAAVVTILLLTGKNKGDSEHKHELVWHEEVAATCTEDGRMGYYSCKGCDMLFDKDMNEVTMAELTIKAGHVFENLICKRCGLDLNPLAELIASLPDEGYTLEDIETITKAKAIYDGLTDDVKKYIPDVDKLEKAIEAVAGIELVADAGLIKSAGQCDQSLKGFELKTENMAGFGNVATVSYSKWQWANYCYNSADKIPVGTKVAFGVYNASDKEVGMHWGNASTLYTNSNLVTLKPGWNMVTFSWDWDKSADNGDYLISSHLYALSPAGSDIDTNGWKFTGMFTYTDDAVFDSIIANSVKKAGVSLNGGSLETVTKKAVAGVIEAISKISGGSYTLEDVAQISKAQDAYDALSDELKASVTNASVLKKAANAIAGIRMIAGADMLMNAGQCDVTGFDTQISEVSGLGDVATLSYSKWQWANWKYGVTNKIDAGTKVAVLVYNASSEARTMHWGNASTLYTQSDLATLQPGWNLVTFKWDWTKNADGGDYLVTSHLYALSPAGSTDNINGWKFGGMFTYSDDAVFDGIVQNSFAKAGVAVKGGSIAANEDQAVTDVINAISKLSGGNYTFADVAQINAAQDAYNALSDTLKQKVTNASTLTNAVNAISGIRLVAAAKKVVSAEQCPATGYQTTVAAVAGIGDAVTLSYSDWQWANWKYASTDKIAVGTKVAVSIYNPTNEVKYLHWGNASTLYTNSNMAELQPGWNVVRFTWDWNLNVDGGDYLITSHLYALSPVGNGENMNGWKFGGMYTYTSDDLFKTVANASLTAAGSPVMHEHTYTKHDKVEATCTTDGKELYYTCDGCGKIFDANKKEVEEKTLIIKAGHHFVDGVCEGCGMDVKSVNEAIENLSLANLTDTLALYDALPEEGKAQVTAANKSKLTPYRLIKIISADTLDNDSSCGSQVTFTSGKDDVYGPYGELTHTASWANVYYNDATSLVDLNKDMVVYIYNSLAEDKTISFGYLNGSKAHNIFDGPGYVTVTLKTGKWTKVVIPKTTSYEDAGMILSRIRMVVGAVAGDGTNITGFKMSSLYIVDDAATLDALVSETQESASETVKKAIETMTLANYADVIAQYDELSAEDKALVTNANKLETYRNMTVIAASTLTSGQGDGTITIDTSKSDNIYGSYGTITHSGAWKAAIYNSDYQLMGLNKKLVVYMYNPNETDVDIAFGYINDSQPQGIYGNQCYQYATLTANAWTKVVIDWTDAYNYHMPVQFMQMIASTGGACTAGSGTNLTGIKMSSLYIVDDASVLDALTPAE